MKKAVSGVTLTLMILTSMLMLAFSAKPVRAWTGTVYIQADGTINPSSAPIITNDKVTYTLIDDIAGSIIIRRNNSIIEGAHHIVKGDGIIERGVMLYDAFNVTVTNLSIENFKDYGIDVDNSLKISILGNSLINNIIAGIKLSSSNNNYVNENVFDNNGLLIYDSYGNIIVNNVVNGKPLVYLENASNTVVQDAGQVVLVRCNRIMVENCKLSSASVGIQLWQTNNTIITNNLIANNSWGGIYISYSSNNSMFENNVTNDIGIFQFSNNNSIFRNNITNADVYIQYSSNNNTISENSLTNGGINIRVSSNNSIFGNNVLNGGIGLHNSHNNVISNNSIVKSSWGGLGLSYSSNNTIINNFISNSFSGISISDSVRNTFVNNNVLDNYYGIDYGGYAYFFNNIIYLNNFNNTYNVKWNGIGPPTHSLGNWSSPTPITYSYYGRTCINYLGNYWSDYKGTDHYSGPYQNETGSDGIGDTPYYIDENNTDYYPLMNPWTPTLLIEEWLFDSDFQYNLDDDYGTVEGNGHLMGTATLSAGTLFIEGQITLNGTLPPRVPEVYLIATDGSDRELAKQAVDLSIFNYWQTGTNTYNFTGQISNVIQPINNGHYEAQALITYNAAKYEFFVNTTSLINSHYFPLIPFGPINKPPICIITLEKDGVEVDQVNLAEFFDIFAGYSTDDKGIKQIRFSSDDVQDGIPTGQWTNWFDWDISGQDWDASTKIKRWSFATPGHKEVWAEAKDEEGQTNLCSDIIFVPAPALPVLVSPLVITPIKEIYNVGDNLEATFTIKNIGQAPITFDVLTVGGRLNGFIPPDGAPDFTHRSVTLQPNEQYQYQGFLTLTRTGNYHFFVAYYIKNPNSDEKKLLDENNWNTCVDLGGGLTHNDRVKNIIVYEEGVVPEEVSDLYETINRRINRKTQYPAYLIDPDQGSWAASVWVTISSVWTRVQEEYDELWNAGVDHDCLSLMEAIYAKRFLDKGDIDSAKQHLQNSFLHDKISSMYFGAAAEIFDANIKRAEEMVKSTLKLIEVGVSLLNPMAGKFASYMFMVPNYIADTDLVGVEQAQKNAVRDLVFKAIFSECKYPELGDRTFENYFNNRIGKITFPYLQKIFENNEAVQFYLSKVLKEAASEGMEWLYDKADSLSEKIVDELSKRFEEYTYKKFSAIELRVLNPQGEITGQINGSVRHDISRSFYRNGTITILFPSGSYICEVAGKEEGTYGLEISSVEARNVTTFTATEIPTSTKVIHRYAIDWNALSLGEEGVIVQADSDGDGFFEKAFASDSKLTYKEFMFPARAIFTFNALWEGFNYPVIVSSSNSTVLAFNFRQSLKQISFEVSGETGTSGYCNVTIPKNLLKGEPWTVRLNGTDWTFTATQNETHSFLYFTYTHSCTYEITIQGTWVISEFPSTLILAIFMLTTLIATTFWKTKRKSQLS